MCGRFTLHTSPEVIAQQFELPETPMLAPRYNIAPTQPVAIVRVPEAGPAREWALVHWGLIPSWSKDPSMGARMINARAETVEEKPAFRAAFKRRRCLLPADGFYEWRSMGKSKQPYYISLRDGSPFALAGLWESWTSPDGGVIESCTILTTEPNELMATLHNRMPVIIDEPDYGLWLGSGGDASKEELGVLPHLLRPFPAEAMTTYPVSKYVNSPINEGAACIAPLDPV
jgi:putative SOS response-associated peptidase YedK